MPLYDSLLIRLQLLPLSVPSLNALVPLLTSAFSHIPPPALGPAAFQRFFHTVHARLAAPSNAYSDELRLCIDAWVCTYGGGKWPSGMVPLSSSSQTQTQFQMEARSMMAMPAPPVVGEEVGERVAHVRSIEVIGLFLVFWSFVETDPRGSVARSYPGLPMSHLKRCFGYFGTGQRTYPRFLEIHVFHIAQSSFANMFGNPITKRKL